MYSNKNSYHLGLTHWMNNIQSIKKKVAFEHLLRRVRRRLERYLPLDEVDGHINQLFLQPIVKLHRLPLPKSYHRKRPSSNHQDYISKDNLMKKVTVEKEAVSVQQDICNYDDSSSDLAKVLGAGLNMPSSPKKFKFNLCEKSEEVLREEVNGDSSKQNSEIKRLETQENVPVILSSTNCVSIPVEEVEMSGEFTALPNSSSLPEKTSTTNRSPTRISISKTRRISRVAFDSNEKDGSHTDNSMVSSTLGKNFSEKHKIELFEKLYRTRAIIKVDSSVKKMKKPTTHYIKWKKQREKVENSSLLLVVDESQSDESSTTTEHCDDDLENISKTGEELETLSPKKIRSGRKETNVQRSSNDVLPKAKIEKSSRNHHKLLGSRQNSDDSGISGYGASSIPSSHCDRDDLKPAEHVDDASVLKQTQVLESSIAPIEISTDSSSMPLLDNPNFSIVCNSNIESCLKHTNDERTTIKSSKNRIDSKSNKNFSNVINKDENVDGNLLINEKISREKINDILLVDTDGEMPANSNGNNLSNLNMSEICEVNRSEEFKPSDSLSQCSSLKAIDDIEQDIKSDWKQFQNSVIKKSSSNLPLGSWCKISSIGTILDDMDKTEEQLIQEKTSITTKEKSIESSEEVHSNIIQYTSPITHTSVINDLPKISHVKIDLEPVKVMDNERTSSKSSLLSLESQLTSVSPITTANIQPSLIPQMKICKPSTSTSAINQPNQLFFNQLQSNNSIIVQQQQHQPNKFQSYTILPRCSFSKLSSMNSTANMTLELLHKVLINFMKWRECIAELEKNLPYLNQSQHQEYHNSLLEKFTTLIRHISTNIDLIKVIENHSSIYETVNYIAQYSKDVIPTVFCIKTHELKTLYFYCIEECRKKSAINQSQNNQQTIKNAPINSMAVYPSFNQLTQPYLQTNNLMPQIFNRKNPNINTTAISNTVSNKAVGSMGSCCEMPSISGTSHGKISNFELRQPITQSYPTLAPPPYRMPINYNMPVQSPPYSITVYREPPKLSLGQLSTLRLQISLFCQINEWLKTELEKPHQIALYKQSLAQYRHEESILAQQKREDTEKYRGIQKIQAKLNKRKKKELTNSSKLHEIASNHMNVAQNQIQSQYSNDNPYAIHVKQAIKQLSTMPLTVEELKKSSSISSSKGEYNEKLVNINQQTDQCILKVKDRRDLASNQSTTSTEVFTNESQSTFHVEMNAENLSHDSHYKSSTSANDTNTIVHSNFLITSNNESVQTQLKLRSDLFNRSIGNMKCGTIENETSCRSHLLLQDEHDSTEVTQNKKSVTNWYSVTNIKTEHDSSIKLTKKSNEDEMPDIIDLDNDNIDCASVISSDSETVILESNEKMDTAVVHDQSSIDEELECEAISKQLGIKAPTYDLNYNSDSNPKITNSMSISDDTFDSLNVNDSNNSLLDDIIDITDVKIELEPNLNSLYDHSSTVHEFVGKNVEESASQSMCANCNGKRGTVVCECGDVSYCSDQCLENHWPDIHSSICKGPHINIKSIIEITLDD